MELDLTRDPAAFLRRAGDHLAADPVLSTVVATIAERHARRAAGGEELPPEDWFCTVVDDGAVVGTAMRTAPFGDRPVYLLPMPDDAARLLARCLVDRGERPLAATGALPAARGFLEEVGVLADDDRSGVEVAKHTRLFEATEVTPPRPTTGHLRVATDADLPLAIAWFAAFHDDADEQAGRPRGSSDPAVDRALDPVEVARRVADGGVHLWVDDGEVVHLTSVNPPAVGSARLGPVYTPPAARGRGYAGAAVAEVTRSVLAAGHRACLFTDQANPTSNALYLALGYRAVVDMAELRRIG